MFLANPIMSTLNNAQVAQNVIEAERTAIGFVLNWLRLIGTGMALIILTYMSLRYINAGPSRRGELKKNLQNYAIGAIVFIGASNIIFYVEQLVEMILADLI